MPSAPLIRKQLLEAIQDAILPPLQAHKTPHLILAELPPRLPDAISVTHSSVPLLDNDESKATTFGQNWPEVRLNSSHRLSFIFVYSGQVDFKLGTTIRMAQSTDIQNKWTKSGCHTLHISTPTILLIPPRIPFSDGSGAHWNEYKTPPDSQVFWLNLLQNGVQCHLCKTENGIHHSEHSLLFKDPDLVTLITLLNDELHRHVADFELVRHAYLLAIFRRLHRHLRLDPPIIANTAWLPAPTFGGSHSPPLANNIVERVDKFVQIHLAEPITLQQIARHCNISPTHLNRLFRASQGISAKRFVNQQRISAAQRVLVSSNLPIKEVARLVGFSQTSHFCQVFQRLTGLTPSEFRNRNRADS